ncbi:MAG: PhoH family protein [Bacteroidales bacterium]
MQRFALAVRALKERDTEIILAAGSGGGRESWFLPGDLREAILLQPLYDALRDMIPAKIVKISGRRYHRSGTIGLYARANPRQCFRNNILDEAQNATELQLKCFVTRMGRSAKFIVTGDITQIDAEKSGKWFG